MRGIYEISTDILYSSIPKEDIMEMAKALGFEHIRQITKATLISERVFYHSALNGAQTRLKISETGELERGKIIADFADDIFENKISKFKLAVKNGRLQDPDQILEEKYKAVEGFIQRLSDFQKDKKWDESTFKRYVEQNLELKHRWQNKAFETFIAIQNNIAAAAYNPSDGWSVERVTLEWAKKNLEYKHYRDIGRRLVDEYFNSNVSQEKQLVPQEIENRKTLIICGPICSGKSALLSKYLDSTTEKDGSNYILSDADYLKFALARSAIKDGVLKKYTGQEIHNESSNALLEGATKRNYLLRKNGKAPNTIISSITFGQLQIEEFLYNGGNAEIHSISISPELSLKTNGIRSEVIGRSVPENDLKWSIEASTTSILDISNYKGKKIEAYLYERTEDKGIKNFGLINCQESKVFITDISAFVNMASRLYLVDKNAAKKFMGTFIENGFDICILDKSHEQIFTLNSKKELKINNNEAFTKLSSENLSAINTLREISTCEKIGNIKVKNYNYGSKTLG